MSGKRSNLQLEEEETNRKQTNKLLPEILGVEEVLNIIICLYFALPEAMLIVPVLEGSKKDFITLSLISNSNFKARLVVLRKPP